MRDVLKAFRETGTCSTPGQDCKPLFELFEFCEVFLDPLHLVNRISGKLQKKIY